MSKIKWKTTFESDEKDIGYSRIRIKEHFIDIANGKMISNNFDSKEEFIEHAEKIIEEQKEMAQLYQIGLDKWKKEYN